MVLGRTDPIDEALRYLATAMSNALHNLLKNIQLSSIKEEDLEDCMDVTMYNVEKVTLPLIFQKLPSSITKVLAVRNPVLSRRKWLTCMKKETQWRGLLEHLQTYHRTGNVPLRISALLSGQFQLQQCVDDEETVSVTDVNCLL